MRAHISIHTHNHTYMNSSICTFIHPSCIYPSTSPTLCTLSIDRRMWVIQTDGQAGRHTNRQKNRQSHMHWHPREYITAYRQTDTQTDTHSGRQTLRHAYLRTHTQTDSVLLCTQPHDVSYFPVNWTGTDSFRPTSVNRESLFLHQSIVLWKQLRTCR